MWNKYSTLFICLEVLIEKVLAETLPGLGKCIGYDWKIANYQHTLG